MRRQCAKPETAAACYAQAAAGAAAAGDRKLEAAAAFFAGLAHQGAEQYAEAIPLFERSASINHELNVPAQEASALLNKASCLQQLGDAAGAIPMFEKVLAIRRAAGDREGIARSLYGIANAHLAMGDPAQALDAFRRSLPYWREVKQQFGEADTHNALGLVYAQLGDSERAAGEYEDALKLWRALGDKGREAYTLNNLCLSSLSAGEARRAADQCQRGFALVENGPDRRAQAYLLQNLADAKLALVDHGAARELTLRSVAIKRELEDRWGEAHSLQTLGEIQRATNHNSEAEDLLNQSLALRRAIHDKAGEIKSLGSLARMHRGLGKLGEAAAEIASAVRLIEESRTGLASQDLRAIYFASQRDYYALQIGILVQQRRAAESLEACERARGRLLLDRLSDTLAEVRRGVNPALLARERVVQQRLNTAAKARQPASEKALNALLAESRDIAEQIRKASPRYAGLVAPPLLKAPAIQGLLDRDTAMLVYFLGPTASYLWIVTASDVTIRELPPRGQIDGRLREFGETISRRADWIANAKALTQLLVGPASSKLGLVRPKRIVIAPDGGLEAFPFALLMPDYEVVTLPSASALSLARARRRAAPASTIAIFADPVFSREDPRAPASAPADDGAPLPRLRFSRLEATQIAALVAAAKRSVALDFEASKSSLDARPLAGYGVLHFATHAILDDTRPALSAIALSRFDAAGKPAADAFLRLHEIYNLNLQARLVTLSACRSAAGKPLAGEGLMSITRGFLYAGAASVLAALWDIDDRATAELMRRFYEGFLTRGMAPAAALRAAQQGIRATPGWEHPYYWAGFALQGEWRP